jgi:hypothetical protein
LPANSLDQKVENGFGQVVETPAAEGKHSSEAKGLAPEPESEEDERDLFAPASTPETAAYYPRTTPPLPANSLDQKVENGFGRMIKTHLPLCEFPRAA